MEIGGVWAGLRWVDMADGKMIDDSHRGHR